MANRNWRQNNNYQTYNQILTPVRYYQQSIYSNERNNYVGQGGYRADNYKYERKDFQGNRERFTPNKRRSPNQRAQQENHNNFRKEPKKSHGHYEVTVPRLTFDIKELSASSLKFRYPRMHIPLDFFHTRLNAQEAFPLYRPMKLGNHLEFQILNKGVETDVTQLAGSEPADVDYRFSAKVMLMTTPALPDLYKAACHMPVDGQHRYGLYKNVQFLVGNKGKNEPMAIGGPWSPSLDGLDPTTDPEVLVRTAIRTCKSLTGIDLSKCKKWYKFLDIHYYRTAVRQTVTIDNNGEKTEENEPADVAVEPQVDIVTIFIPDIWSCSPSAEEWTEIKQKYEEKLRSLLNPVVEEVKGKVDETMDIMEETEDKKEEIAGDIKEETEDMKEEIAMDTKEESEDKKEETCAVDLNLMKVTELRAELASRGLETKGLKLQLVERLQEAMKNEHVIPAAHNETKEENHVIKEKSVEIINDTPKIESVNKITEKEQKRLERLYRMNEKPSLLVYPTKMSNGTYFECTLMSLDSLLQCRGDDQKEPVFEVSLFAEQFHEMMQRDAAFTIYKALHAMPDVAKEAKEEDDEPETKKSRVVENVSAGRRSKVIADVDLWFAFSVFDCDNGGYVRDHDLEDILHSIGLNLSRSQARKLVAKLPMRKGTVVYRDVVERDVIEGSGEDVVTLRSGEENMATLAALSHGNNAFFDESDNETLGTRTGQLGLMDRLTVAEKRRLDVQVQMTLLKDELHKVQTAQSGATEVETHLRENIGKLEDKLRTERETKTKLCDVTTVYCDLLVSASEHMGVSMKAINGRLEAERLEADRIRQEEEDRVKKQEEDERMAKEEEDRVKKQQEDDESKAKEEEEADEANDDVEMVESVQ